MRMRRVAAAVCVAVVAACGGDGAVTSSGPDSGSSASVAPTDPPATLPAPGAAVPRGWLDTEQRRRADQLISTFENSTTEISYAYAENLDDGRGVTAGRAGFTTATCDALAVIEVYSETSPGNALSRFIPTLEHLCEAQSDDTSGLPEGDFVAAWRAAADDAEFRRAQDQIVDREYYRPAMAAADALGLRTAIARAALRHRDPARVRG